MATYRLSRTAIIAIAILVSAALIASIYYLVIMEDDDGNEGTWNEGDFVEWGTYYYELGGEPGDPAGFQRFTVTDVGSEWLTINKTVTDMAGDLLSWQTTHFAANSTGFGFSNSSLESLGYNITDLGADNVETEWGTLSAQHYRYNYTYAEVVYTVDVWTRSGFFIAQRVTADVGLQMLVLLTDTNISEIYSV
ncbi:MAG: hypothetical protein AB9860_08420 [Methanomassiliicoccales archaeon]